MDEGGVELDGGKDVEGDWRPAVTCNEGTSCPSHAMLTASYLSPQILGKGKFVKERPTGD